jgi:hypothetical protein
VFTARYGLMPFVERSKKHTLCPITFFPRTYAVYDNVEKHGSARKVTDDNTAHAPCMLDNHGYRHKLRAFNTFCFPTATVVSQTRLNVTLYQNFLSFFLNINLQIPIAEADWFSARYELEFYASNSDKRYSLSACVISVTNSEI